MAHLVLNFKQLWHRVYQLKEMSWVFTAFLRLICQSPGVTEQLTETTIFSRFKGIYPGCTECV